ncbi:hypothetical protein, partial [Xanthomonas sacchari]|uniref:hypothetical protein n=1 Tax=Xanthomonas sacchari TaxID=56458 RepID=UPI00225E0CF7
MRRRVGACSRLVIGVIERPVQGAVPSRGCALRVVAAAPCSASACTLAYALVQRGSAMKPIQPGVAVLLL